MNKLIIICGGDRLGKGTLIKGLCEHFDYKNITIRHCDKPPKNIPQNEVLDYQIKAFEQEMELILYLERMNPKFMYHDNIIIFDRFHLGEFVYGQMFRNYDSKLLKETIITLENKFLKDLKYVEPYLITLTANPQFFLQKEDGHSFSQTIEQKTKELELFKEAHCFSIIQNKKIIKVNNDNNFREKNDILQDVISFLDL